MATDPNGYVFDTTPVKSYCIAHTDPVIPYCDDTFILEIGPRGTISSDKYRRIVNCFEYIDYGEEFREQLGSTLGAFAATRHLRQNYDRLDFAINISTYRTFMLPDKRAKYFQDPPKLNYVTPAEAQDLSSIALPKDVNFEWRLPSPLKVASIAKQYERWLPIEDLALYMDIAVAEGVLTKEQREDCWHRPVLLPGALSIGMMPADVFCDLNEQTEIVTLSFLKQAENDWRDNYQIRAANFCHERLGSYLIDIYLHQNFGGLPKTHFGYWTRVNEDRVYTKGLVGPLGSTSNSSNSSNSSN